MKHLMSKKMAKEEVNAFCADCNGTCYISCFGRCEDTCYGGCSGSCKGGAYPIGPS